MIINKIEIQDHEGNIYHPHTTGNVVFLENGETVENKIKEVLQSGVNAKNGMKEAINSKITVPDVSDADAWNTYIQRVKDIKEGRGNAGTGDVLSGKTFTNDGGQMLTGTIPNRGGAQTVTPGTSNKVLNSGYYSGNITVAGDADLVASNILSGKNIFGINGTLKPAKMATGNVPSPTNDALVTVRGLSFTPHAVVGVTYDGSSRYHGIPSLAVDMSWITGGSISGGKVLYGRTSSSLYMQDVTFYSDGFQLCESSAYTYQNVIKWYAFRYE